MSLKRKSKYQVYEHLEHYVKNTTYAQRLQWLEEANEFVRKIQKKRPANLKDKVSTFDIVSFKFRQQPKKKKIGIKVLLKDLKSLRGEN